MTESATGAGLGPGASLSKGRFVIELLSRIEAAGHRVVYLRNYENLPDDIGNDVDILIERGKTKAVVSLFRQAATEYGWRVWKSVPFSCLDDNTMDAILWRMNQRAELYAIRRTYRFPPFSDDRWNAVEDAVFLDLYRVAKCGVTDRTRGIE